MYYKTKLQRFRAIERSGGLKDLLIAGMDKRKARRLLRTLPPKAGAYFSKADLSGTFCFMDTKQGHTYWWNLYEKARDNLAS